MDELADLGLREAAAGLRSGRFSSEDYTRACLERIAAREPGVGAWAWLDAQAALARARAADAATARGPLHGIPLAIKDIMHTRGIPTEMGSAAYAGFVPPDSAAVVAAIEAAGAFVLGKTVTAELAYYTPGKTRNPWNPAHTPGGSSSGSAASVAAGMVPGALGTQTNGSVIRPAAYCGVVGFKPSAGLIPRTGILAFSPTLDQVGVFTRGVADAGQLASVLVDAEAGAIGPGLAEVASRTRPPRLRAVRSPVWDQAEAAQRGCFADSLAALRRAGAEVEERELPAAFAEAHAAHRTIMYHEAAHGLRALQAHARAKLSAPLNALIDEGLGIAPADYEAALERRAALARMLEAALDGFDAVVTPPAAGEAPATLAHTGSPAFCTIWSLCGVPAITVPAGRGPAGLPLGLQLVGRDRGDAALLAAAAWCENAVSAQARIGTGAVMPQSGGRSRQAIGWKGHGA